MSSESLEQLALDHAVQTRPRYDWLQRYLRGELDAGRLQPGQALPSEHQLAENLRISRSTVRQALADLEREGMVHRIRGKGTYVRETPNERQTESLTAFALVMPESQGGFYPSLLRCFETAAKQVRHQVIFSSTNNDLKQQESILLQLLDKRVAGVTLVPVTAPATPAYQMRRLEEAGIPMVFCHRSVEGVHAPLLALPYHKMGRMAGEAFVKFGHRRVACLATHRDASTEAYAGGLREAMRAGGGDLAPEFAYYCSNSDASINEEAIAGALRKMLQHGDPPTGIMTNSDALAETVYMQLTAMGLEIPADISLIGIGDTCREGAIVRRLSSVTVDETEVGRRAVELLHQMQTGQRELEDTERILLQPSFADGQTLGEAPQCGQSRQNELSLVPEP